MLSTAIDLCKSAVDVVLKGKEMRHDTKVRAGILLEEIAKILEDTANKLSVNEYPHFNCALMEKMCDHFHFHLTGAVPEDQLDELYESMKEASQVEKQFAIRHEPDTIPSIFKAAGEFKALGLLLKI